MPTLAEIVALKNSWLDDPCWNIEETEGFEAHYDQLLAFRKDWESKWEQSRHAEYETHAIELGTTNITLAAYLLYLEERIANLEEKESK